MRIQINLSEDMVSKVDSYASRMGVSRSALCSVFIGQGIMSYENAKDATHEVVKILNSNLEQQVENEKK